MRIGIIAYDTNHLKTEQLVLSYVNNPAIDSITIFALSFVQRPKRNITFEHRPEQSEAIQVSDLTNFDKVTFQRWDGKQNLPKSIDCHIITGAGIIDVSLAQGVPIVNAHPGIIPTTRGLDSFKWAILDNDPIGVTLHFIDQEVDKGEVLTIQQTPVFPSDSIQLVARRHYECEIDLMKNIPELLGQRETSFGEEKPAKMRMPLNIEKTMLANFQHWKSLYAGTH